MRRKPIRVQLAAIPSITIREPGTSTAAATWKAADDGSPGTWRSRSSSSSWGSSATGRRRGGCRRRSAAAGARCGRGSARARSRWCGRRPASPASSTHDLICAEATGSSYSMPRSGEPVTVNGAKRSSRASIRAPISPQRRRRSGPPAAGGSTRRRPASSSRPGCPASQPGQQPHQRPGVADVDDVAARARRRAARSRGSSGRPRGARPARRAPGRRPASSSCPPRRGSP